MAHDTHTRIIDKVIDVIIERRKLLGFSHEKVASLVGLHRSAISLIESKKITPSVINIYKICSALNLSLAETILKIEQTDKKE